MNSQERSDMIKTAPNFYKPQVGNPEPPLFIVDPAFTFDIHRIILKRPSHLNTERKSNSKSKNKMQTPQTAPKFINNITSRKKQITQETKIQKVNVPKTLINHYRNSDSDYNDETDENILERHLEKLAKTQKISHFVVPKDLPVASVKPKIVPDLKIPLIPIPEGVRPLAKSYKGPNLSLYCNTASSSSVKALTKFNGQDDNLPSPIKIKKEIKRVGTGQLTRDKNTLKKANSYKHRKANEMDDEIFIKRPGTVKRVIHLKQIVFLIVR